MPGKVNPVVPESVTMIAAQVIGNDATITVAGQSGNFQLNVMLPVIAYNLLQSLQLLAIGSRNLADHALAGFTVNHARLEDALARNPILVTALNPLIGYEKGAAIAKKAYAEGRPILEVAAEMTDLSADELRRLLDPKCADRGRHQGRCGDRKLTMDPLYSARRTFAKSLDPRLRRRRRTCSGWSAASPEVVARVRASIADAAHARRPCWCRWWSAIAE